MRRIALSVLFVLVLAAPAASASDPLLECVDESVCVGPGTCTPAVCVPRSCQPAAHCRSEVASASDCAVNLTIEGKTCQLVLGLALRANQGPYASAGVAFTQGNVDAFNLRNTWLAPSAQLGAGTDPVGLGDVSAGVYVSRIFTDGTPGPIAALAGAQEHEYDQVVVFVHHGQGIGGSETILVGAYLLDFAPEGCYARTTTSSVFDCREALATLP